MKNQVIIFIPIIIVEITLMVIALRHILTHSRYKTGNRIFWVLVTVFIQIIGPILYLILGKEDE